MASSGLWKTRWRASVSSTTPRLGERWPPVEEMWWTRNSRISAASSPSWSRSSPRTSAGERIASSTSVSLTGGGRHEFRQSHQQPSPRPQRATGQGGQLGVVVPGAAGDVQVEPRPSLHEGGEEERSGDGPRLAVEAVLQVRDLAPQQRAVVGAERHSPDALAGALGGAPGQGPEGIVVGRGQGEGVAEGLDRKST